LHRSGNGGKRTPRLIGINHVALEVRNVEKTLAFWRQLFDIGLPEREAGAAFIELGDQFISLMGSYADGGERHFGLVVDDKEATRSRLEQLEAEILPGTRLDFRDPDGNRIQVVQYDQIKFEKSDTVLRQMGLDLRKKHGE
jgi:lactoylglutathione lyase